MCGVETSCTRQSEVLQGVHSGRRNYQERLLEASKRAMPPRKSSKPMVVASNHGTQSTADSLVVDHDERRPVGVC